MKLHVAALLSLVPFFAFAQEQTLTIQDPSQLVGKKVIVQRLPLCQPGTFNYDVSRSGKQATVVSAKAAKAHALPSSALARLTPDMRELLLDQQKAALLLLQFDDGAKFDTCAALGPKKLSEYLELAPGESLAPTPASAHDNAPAAATPAKPSPSNSTDDLSESDINAAIGGRGKDHFVMIQDMGLMAAQGNQVPSITLYMPDAVLAMRAASARKQFLQFSPEDEDKRRSLMIVAEGYAGKTITEGCTSITRIALLSDPAGGTVKEAYLSEQV